MQCNRKLALVVLTKIDSLFFYHIIGYLVQNTHLIHKVSLVHFLYYHKCLTVGMRNYFIESGKMRDY